MTESENKMCSVILPYVCASWFSKTVLNAFFAVIWTFWILYEMDENTCKSVFIASQLAQYVFFNVLFMAFLDDSFSIPIVGTLKREGVDGESWYYLLFLSWVPTSYALRLLVVTVVYTIFFALIPTMLLAIIGGQQSFGCTAGIILLTFYGGTVATSTHMLLLCRSAVDSSTCPIYFDYETSQLCWSDFRRSASFEDVDPEPPYDSMPEHSNLQP